MYNKKTECERKKIVDGFMAQKEVNDVDMGEKDVLNATSTIRSPDGHYHRLRAPVNVVRSVQISPGVWALKRE